MHRMIIALMVPILAIILVAVTLAQPVEPLPALFKPEQCQRMDLVDLRLRPVEGIEDIVVLQDGRIFFSAHNRRYAEIPVRGIYVSTLQELDIALQEGRNLSGLPIGGAQRVVQSFFPHGIAADRSGQRFAFVNRPTRGEGEVLWGRLDGNNQFRLQGRWSAPEACRANDLEWRGAELLATRDRQSCGSSLTDLMPGADTGTLISVRPDRFVELESGLSFANGVVLSGGRVIVAETRADQMRILGTDTVIELPGGPDNLTRGPLGTVLVALHTDLFDYWLYAMGYADTAPSRIVAVNPDTGAIDVLFDDPLGKHFSGASVAVFTSGRLIMGSAYDRGLYVCSR